ncbi:YdcF family protein [Candidatus Liberibacter sp.]|uniref:YdcF family protein n=1 Tax=Candidatus Liberibacter sp. TaxID=34022 RepID=UPI0028701C4A|nr:YdcF family protein [Candidatus Liberibacter sp.]
MLSVYSLKIPKNPSVNAIIVLTGETNRIEKAFELLENKIGERLLVSGVHRSISKNKFLQKNPQKKNLIMCYVDIGYEARNTTENARESSEWARKNRYKKVLIVTSDYHMLRSILELKQIDKFTRFIPYPVVSNIAQRNVFISKLQMLKVLFIEYLKVILSFTRISLQPLLQYKIIG